jgi:hypothetical protein
MDQSFRSSLDHARAQCLTSERRCRSRGRSDCSSRGGGHVIFQLRGLPQDPIRGFNVRQSAFTNIADPIDQYAYVEDIDFEDVTINGKPVSR